MTLDSLQSRERQVLLFERYGSLLTEHQRQVLDLHLRRDWSLSEIARTKATSRAAVHDLVRRAGLAMEGYESRLGLVADHDRRRAAGSEVTRELAELRRRLGRLEAQLGAAF